MSTDSLLKGYDVTPHFGRISRRRRMGAHFFGMIWFFWRGDDKGKPPLWRSIWAAWILSWPDAWPTPDELRTALGRQERPVR